MPNPYETPMDIEPSHGKNAEIPPAQHPGMVGQIRIVSILMMVQGGLNLLAGFGLIAMGVFMGFAMKDAFAQNQQLQQGDGPSPEVMANIMSFGYGGIGVMVLIIGFLNIYAGYRNWQYKSRTLGIVAFFSGLGTILTCYCAPTSLALCIYGMIVYLNSSSTLAFRMGEDGFSGDQITMTFSPLRQHQQFQAAGQQPMAKDSPFKE